MKRSLMPLLVVLSVLAGSVLLAGPQRALAVTLYASTGDDNLVGGGLLYTIDTVTGVVTFVGDTTLSRLGGIDFNSSGVLYAVDGGSTGPSALYTIDPTTAAATFVGPIEGIQGVDALRFAPNGTLFGGGWDSSLPSDEEEGPPGRGRLITIDPATGALLTAITQSGSGNDITVGLAFNSSGTLYGSRGNAIGRTDDLVTIDTATGGLSAIGTATNVISDIWFAPDGTLYGISPRGRRFDEGPATDLFTIDPVTGAKTLLFTIPGLRFAGLTGTVDRDGDGVLDTIDNCPDTPNPDQLDSDGNGVGDACEPDRDSDGVPNAAPDNCPDDPNPDQLDSDGDGIGNACDRCPIPNTLEENVDEDGDGIGDFCSTTPGGLPIYSGEVVTDGDQTPPPAGSARIVTATFHYEGIDRDGDGTFDPITVFWKGCFSFSFTVVRQPGNIVLDPIFRHTAALAIPDDLVTFQPGESRSVQCNLGEMYDPEILSAGSYDVHITFSSRAQDPDLSPDGTCADPPCFAVDIIQVTSPPAPLVIGTPPPGAPTIAKQEIDIQPRSDNRWFCRSNLLIPVAVLGRADFDVSRINHKLVRYGKTGTEARDPTRNTVGVPDRLVDVNSDGFPDMLFRFRFTETGFKCTDIPAGTPSIEVSPILTGPVRVPKIVDGLPVPGQFETIQFTASDTLELRRSHFPPPRTSGKRPPPEVSSD